ncbi:MAG: ABC transporter permease [Filifactoraceae bacterium]
MNLLKTSSKWFFLIFIASLFAFFIVRLTPGNPVNMYLELLKVPPTVENKCLISTKFGLDKPIYIQYIKWFTNFIKGDWGNSFYCKTPLKTEFLRCLPYSLAIGIGGIFFASIFSFFLGYAIALKPLGFLDKLSRFFLLLSQTIPTFVLAIVLIYIIAIKFKFFLIFTGTSTSRVILGIILVSLSHIGTLSRIVYEHFKNELKKTYIKSYIVRGINPHIALIRYGSIPAIYGLIAGIIEKLSWAIGGTAVVEVSLNIPGISNFMVSSIAYRDYFVLQAYIFIMALWMFFVHITLNFLLYIINRRNFYEE